MEVRFDSDQVREARRHLLEYYLLNHPLDCPVCDKAGECYLQDYAEQYADVGSRMVEPKHTTPKKDLGAAHAAVFGSLRDVQALHAFRGRG